MKKNVFLNLLYCGLLGLVGIVNLIIACVVGDKGDLFFLVFCSMLALLLLHAGEIRKLIVEYSSMILYPCVAFVLFMCLYFITNKILYKKNKEVSMFGYVLVPLISFVVQILIFYYWYVGLIVLAVVWIVLTILGLGLEIFSCSTSDSSNSLPKYNSKKYNYKSEIEKQMGYLQSVHTQIRGWNVKEIQGKLVIEVVCKIPDAKYIEGILREYFTNEIRFLYV